MIKKRIDQLINPLFYYTLCKPFLFCYVNFSTHFIGPLGSQWKYVPLQEGPTIAATTRQFYLVMQNAQFSFIEIQKISATQA